MEVVPQVLMWKQVMCIINMKTQQYRVHRWEYTGTPRQYISSILTSAGNQKFALLGSSLKHGALHISSKDST